MKLFRRLAVIALVLAGCACSGSTGRVTFDHLKYPVSLSPVLERGQRTSPRRVGRLKATARSWSILYRFIDINETVDISPYINERIEAAGGVGIINLRIAVSACVINYVWPLNWLPVWPSCSVVKMRGDIVAAR